MFTKEKIVIRVMSPIEFVLGQHSKVLRRGDFSYISFSTFTDHFDKSIYMNLNLNSPLVVRLQENI